MTVLQLGTRGSATELLDPLQMLPAPGQGALACECRGEELTDAENLGRQVAAELLDLGAARWVRDPAPRSPGRGLMGDE